MLSGTATIGSNTKDTKAIEIKKGETLEVSKIQNELIKIERDLELLPKFPGPNARVYGKYIQFSWRGDKADWIEIDDSPAFLSSKRVKVTNFSGKTVLPIGNYYWRISRENRTSRHQEFTLLPGVRYIPIFPKIGSKIRLGKIRAIKWKKVRAAKKYALQISKSNKFNNLIINKECKTHKCKLDELPPGNYFWRIRATHPTYGDWPFSEAFSFEIKDSKPLRAPKHKRYKILKKRSNLKSYKRRQLFALSRFYFPLFLYLNTAEAQEQIATIEFGWENVSAAKSYRVEISNSITFATILSFSETNLNSAKVEIPRGKVWYWHVAARDKRGKLGKYSSAEMISVPLKKPKKIVKKRKEKKRKKPKPPPPLDKSIKFRAGIVPNYLVQNFSHSGLKVSGRGIALNQSLIWFRMGSPFGPWEFRLDYLKRQYESNDSPISDFQGNFEHEHLGIELWLMEGIVPLNFGISARKEPDYFRIASERFGVRAVAQLSALVGKSYKFELNPKIVSRFDFTGELSPLGEVKGIAVLSRIRIGYAYLFERFIPELYFEGKGGYYSISADNKSDIRLTFGLGILIGWDFV